MLKDDKGISGAGFGFVATQSSRRKVKTKILPVRHQKCIIKHMEQGEITQQEAVTTKEQPKYTPKLSIVIPVLNRAHELPRLFESLRTQQYKGEIEIIISDAGSTDGSIELAQNMGYRVVLTPNESGIGATRQVGCEAATGEIIINTDSDCSWPPNYLEAVANAFSDPEVIASYGPVEYTYEGKPAEGLIKKLVQEKMRRDIQRWHKKGQPIMAGPNFAVLKSVYDAVGGFDPRTKRIEEPVVYIPLWHMPGKIAFVVDQKVETELPWQEKGKPSIRKFFAYKAKNNEWVPLAKSVIRERSKSLPEMKTKVGSIIEERKSRLKAT